MFWPPTRTVAAVLLLVATLSSVLVHAAVHHIDTTVEAGPWVPLHNGYLFNIIPPGQHYVQPGSTIYLNLSTSEPTVNKVYCIYNSLQWGNVTDIYSIGRADRYAWPCTRRYEFSSELLVNFTITDQFDKFTHVLLLQPTNYTVTFSGTVTLQNAYGDYLEVPERGYHYGAMSLAPLYMVFVILWTNELLKRNRRNNQKAALPWLLNGCAVAYSLAFTFDAVYFSIIRTSGQYVEIIGNFGTFFMYVGETCFLVVAVSCCLGWSIVDASMAVTEQLAMTLALGFYQAVGIGAAFGMDYSTFFVVLAAFLRVVIGFTLIVGVQATIIRVVQRNAADNSSMMSHQRNTLVLMNAHYRLNCLKSFRSFLPQMTILPAFGLIFAGLFLMSYEFWWNYVVQSVVLWLAMVKLASIFCPRQTEITGFAAVESDPTLDHSVNSATPLDLAKAKKATRHREYFTPTLFLANAHWFALVPELRRWWTTLPPMPWARSN